MTLKERKEYLAQGLSVEIVNKIAKEEETAQRRLYTNMNYMNHNGFKEVSLNDIRDADMLDDISFFITGTSSYYTKSPEEIYIEKETCEYKNQRLKEALKSIEEEERKFIMTLFFRMNGNVSEYAKEFNVKRETIRDFRNRVIRKMKKFF